MVNPPKPLGNVPIPCEEAFRPVRTALSAESERRTRTSSQDSCWGQASRRAWGRYGSAVTATAPQVRALGRSQNRPTAPLTTPRPGQSSENRAWFPASYHAGVAGHWRRAGTEPTSACGQTPSDSPGVGPLRCWRPGIGPERARRQRPQDPYAERYRLGGLGGELRRCGGLHPPAACSHRPMWWSSNDVGSVRVRRSRATRRPRRRASPAKAAARQRSWRPSLTYPRRTPSTAGWSSPWAR